jgi:hypothetical protein
MAGPAATIQPEYDLRQRYGDAIADIIGMHSARRTQQASLTPPDHVKAALQAIVAEPHAADLQRVDALTSALLMDPAWRRMRLKSLCALTREQLAECAKYALDHLPRFRNPRTGRPEVTMTLALLGAAGAWHAARRNVLLREALSLVFASEYRRATSIIKTAHREWHAGK